jgi:pyruvate-ferredoxin/flavodoxin oxidoreductase
MQLAVAQRRAKIADLCAELQDMCVSDDLKAAANEWVASMEDADASKVAAEKLLAAIDATTPCETCKPVLDQIKASADMLVKKSIWIFGGQEWAYDIGYGGLDHVLAMGEDVNVLVLDTELYSNTGGQSSKSTPTGSTAKFAAAGKRLRKKDLGMMAMSYGYVYVATVSMGANPAQLLKAMNEAEAYKGPSLIIAYAPCINHGINMGKSQAEEKKAVEAGYWPLYRYNPDLIGTDTNPFTLDSKEPTGNYREFLMGEIRYTSLAKQYPEVADKLFEQSEEEAKIRLDSYKRLANK